MEALEADLQPLRIRPLVLAPRDGDGTTVKALQSFAELRPFDLVEEPSANVYGSRTPPA